MTLKECYSVLLTKLSAQNKPFVFANRPLIEIQNRAYATDQVQTAANHKGNICNFLNSDRLLIRHFTYTVRQNSASYEDKFSSYFAWDS